MKSNSKQLVCWNRFAWVLIAIGGGIILMFLLRSPFNDWSWNCDATLFGQYGDFIGGFIGTIFSMAGFILLYATLTLQNKTLLQNDETLRIQEQTLRLQQQDSKENRQIFYKQQFDNTFFGLLDMYKALVNDLVVVSNGIEKRGKDFFSYEKEQLQNSFNAKGYPLVKKKIADVAYITYYTINKDKVAHYFRTLYRLFCLIDESCLEEQDKVKYAKILRAQLSESEQFFLYYNACTTYGENFKPLINKYNLLKHLPKLEKLEFGNYRSSLNINEVHAIEMVLYDLKHIMKEAQNHIGTDTEYNLKTYLKGTYTIKAFFPSANQLDVTIIIKNNGKYSPFFQKGFGLNKFLPTTLAYLIRDFLIDYFYLNTFYLLNPYGSMTFINPTIHQEGVAPNTKTIASIKAKTTDNSPIKL